MSERLTDIPNAVVSAHKFDSMAEGNQWFRGRSQGWLNINAKNWGKVEAGDIVVLYYRIPYQKQGGRLPFYHTEEILATVKKVGATRHGDIEFEGPDGKLYATKGWNLVAKKLGSHPSSQSREERML